MPAKNASETRKNQTRSDPSRLELDRDPKALRAKRQVPSASESSETGRDPLAPGLYVVATPIGNLSDLSPRALDILTRCDRIAAEDTRVTGKLLSLIGLKRPMISYNDHNDDRRGPEILIALAQGASIALVSDAGTPLISDPGYRLVAEAALRGHAIIPIPGPSAAIAMLSVAGLPTDRVLFMGFLPARTKARRDSLMEIANLRASLLLFEAPHRLAECLVDLADVLGSARKAVIGREMTKLFEEFRRGTLAELRDRQALEPTAKGEIVLVIGPPVEGVVDQVQADGDLDQALIQALAGHSLKDAVDQVSAGLGLNRRKVYARALELKK
jgi:16S rRNA (cytidine1402-2'-O)-methyltransferase